MTTRRRPLYSILIPTRNGMRYLSYAIDSVLSQASQDFELIVSDNHSKDGTAEYLSGLNDPRLVKLRPDSELPMASHFEFVLSHAQGEWVTSLGDDDAVMPFFFNYLDSLNLASLRADAIVFRRALYFWEGCQELYGDLVVHYEPSKRKRFVNNNWALFLALSSIINYMDLPQLYTSGLVRNNFVKSIKAKSAGVFFHGISPDVSSVAIMAINARQHYRVEQPIFWTGTSPKSVGFSQASVQDKERFEEYDRQNESSAIKLNEETPDILRGKLFLSVLLHDALLVCPGTPRFWKSSIARGFLAAGLIMTGNDEGRETARKIYKGNLTWLRIAPFIFAWFVVKRLHLLNQIFAPSTIAGKLNSNDRTKFPTIAQASQATVLHPPVS